MTTTSSTRTPRHTRDRRRLIAYLDREFGVMVEERDPETAWQWQHRPANWSEAPFTSGLGVVWDEFKIIATTETTWPHLLHEAGHLVATTERPDASKEITFLGWEMAVVEHLGLSMKEFYRGNVEYGVTFGPYNELGAIKFGSKDWWKFVGECQAVSRDADLFRRFDNTPQAVRTNVLR